MPSAQCPFCPGSGRVPDRYDVHIYPNDFPAFSIPAPEPAIQGDGFYRVARSYGRCDVVLYHPDHHTSLPELSLNHLLLLVRLWRKRFVELKKTPGIRYVLIFENKGAVIGVTMPHPHGQIYAFPFIPARLEKEIAAARSYWQARSRSRSRSASSRCFCTRRSWCRCCTRQRRFSCSRSPSSTPSALPCARPQPRCPHSRCCRPPRLRRAPARDRR